MYRQTDARELSRPSGLLPAKVVKTLVTADKRAARTLYLGTGPLLLVVYLLSRSRVVNCPRIYGGYPQTNTVGKKMEANFG